MPETTLPRPHTTRLLYDLRTIREELVQTVQSFTPEQFSLAPRTGMKTVKQQLQEIGTMEAVTARLVMNGELADWNDLWQSLEKDDAETMLAALTALRASTIAYLEASTEEQIETPIPLPTEWQGYFDGATHLEPEELFRWVIRHEYYHLGQLNAYSMMANSATSG